MRIGVIENYLTIRRYNIIQIAKARAAVPARKAQESMCLIFYYSIAIMIELNEYAVVCVLIRLAECAQRYLGVNL